jgi:hypothetical protein
MPDLYKKGLPDVGPFGVAFEAATGPKLGVEDSWQAHARRLVSRPSIGEGPDAGAIMLFVDGGSNMVGLIRIWWLGAFILALGLGSAGCSGGDTGQAPPKGPGGGNMMQQKMKEMSEKHGGGAGKAQPEDKDKEKDKDKDNDKEKPKEDDKN